MASKAARAGLFVSSYFPLWLVIFVLYVADYLWWSIGLLAVGVFSVFGMFAFLKQVQRRNPITVNVVRARRCDHEALSYIVSYLLPFLALPTDEWQKIVAMGTFYILLAYLYINTDMIHINPTLLMIGYRIYEIELNNGDTLCVIARSRILSKSTLRVVHIADGLAVEKHA